jgi:hypothetical protein
VTDEFFKRAVAVAISIADLPADLADRLAFPSHRDGGEMPFWMPRHLAWFEVILLVTNVTSHCRKPMAVNAARHWWLVRPTHIALPRMVTCRMAINAPRVGQYFAYFFEQSH